MPAEVHETKAASGSARADEVATAQRVAHPLEVAKVSASRAIRLFPTPAEPQTMIPEESGSDMAVSMTRNSSARPVSGHLECTHKG